mmetsp:Transcript_40412/g.63091  ORF Transcript_40412/g.63091 Transcript_40412/m.63091 type:complete len:280 (-) Transcript_40412:1461-2300(-)
MSRVPSDLGRAPSTMPGPVSPSRGARDPWFRPVQELWRSAETGRAGPFEKGISEKVMRLALSPAGQLDLDAAHQVHRAMSTVHRASVWMVSSPLAAAICKPWFRCVLGIGAIYHIVMLGLGLPDVLGVFKRKGTQFRFTVEETRTKFFESRFSEVGLLHDRCRVMCDGEKHCIKGTVGDVTIMRFEEEQTVNGFYIVTAGGDNISETTEGDPVRFRMEMMLRRAEAEEAKWETVAASASFLLSVSRSTLLALFLLPPPAALRCNFTWDKHGRRWCGGEW